MSIAQAPALLTRKQLGEVFLKDRRTIQRWAADGMPAVVPGGPGRPSLHSLSACIDWVIEREVQMRGNGDGDNSPAQQRARLDRARRIDLEERLAARRATLVEPEAVDREYREIVAKVSTRFVALADAAAPELVRAAAYGPLRVRQVFREQIDGALLELARSAE